MAKADLDLAAEEERRIVLKDMLNTNLLSPEARKQLQAEYDEQSKRLEAAANKAAS